MNNRSPFEDDILLTGTLTVIVRTLNGVACRRQRVVIRGCGFV